MLKNKKGYNLVELTVVVLIIAILAAIAVPLYRTTVEKTRIMTDFTLLKAMADAVIQYYPEDNAFPTRLTQLHVRLPDGAWAYTGNHVAEKTDGRCTVTLYTDEGDERITLACNRPGDHDWEIDINFIINAAGNLAATTKTFTITSADANRRQTLAKMAMASGWEGVEEVPYKYTIH